jgi:hypothetical protein
MKNGYFSALMRQTGIKVEPGTEAHHTFPARKASAEKMKDGMTPIHMEEVKEVISPSETGLEASDLKRKPSRGNKKADMPPRHNEGPRRNFFQLRKPEKPRQDNKKTKARQRQAPLETNRKQPGHALKFPAESILSPKIQRESADNSSRKKQEYSKRPSRENMPENADIQANFRKRSVENHIPGSLGKRDETGRPSKEPPARLDEVLRWVSAPLVAPGQVEPGEPGTKGGQVEKQLKETKKGGAVGDVSLSPKRPRVEHHYLPEPETREFFLSIGAINLTVEAPEEKSHATGRTATPRAGNERNRPRGSRIGRHYIRI